MTTAYDPHADWAREDREAATLVKAPAALVGQKVHVAYRDELYFLSDAFGELLPGEHVASRRQWMGPAGSAHLVGLAVRGGSFVTVVPFDRVLSVTAVA